MDGTTDVERTAILNNMRTLQCVNESCENRGLQFSDAPDQYPDGRCDVCKCLGVESKNVVMRGVEPKVESLVLTRTTPLPVVELKQETSHECKANCEHDDRDWDRISKDEQVMEKYNR